jgi:hypothetical protein
MSIATHLLCYLCLALWPAQVDSQASPLHRVPTHELRIRLPGVAVIRDSAAWEQLWRRFEQRATNASGIVHAAVPAVDFRTEMLVAVALGPSSGCSNEERNIRRIVERSDSIVVVFGPAHEGPRFTCAAVIEPVDVVRLRRSSKPVAFHPDRPEIPTPLPATWWWRPKPAEFDTMSEVERGVFATALAQDPGTPLSTLAELARNSGTRAWWIGRELLRRPDVRGSADVMMALARWGGDVGRDARDSLFTRHGRALAGKRGTPSDVLGMLIEQLGGPWTPYRQEVARLLLRHKKVRGDRDLLGDFIFRVQNRPDLIAEACPLFLARWSPWDRVMDMDGKPTNGWSSRIPCPNRPPPPRG